jgi:hypothetical protein
MLSTPFIRKRSGPRVLSSASAALHQVAEDADQVAAHRAAEAAVVHLEDLFLGVDDQLLVNADLPELVLDHGNALAVPGGQVVVQQRRLARPQEARQHRHRHPVVT